jgi:hypothetical protein
VQEAAPVINKGTRQLHKPIKKSHVAQASEGGDLIDEEAVQREIYNLEARSEVGFLRPLLLFVNSNVSCLVQC